MDIPGGSINMSQKKYVIGLTGNIATGKSIVLRMLQEAGASTVDADGLVHVLQKPGTPVYKDTVAMFGKFILNKDGSINRKRLGDIAFNVPLAMQALEHITHPAVRQQLERAIEKAPKYVIVIEAVKLLESGLAEKCDAVWVVTCPKEMQVSRLVNKRKMSQQDAIRRVEAQSSQEDKVAKADVVIDNSSDLVKTWNIVQKKFNEIPSPATPPPATQAPKVSTEKRKLEAVDTSSVSIRRAARGDLSAMAELMKASTQGDVAIDEGDMMERLFSKGYLVALQGSELVGLVGWQTENLIAGIDDFFVKTSTMWVSIGKMLLDAVEKELESLSCEAGLIFLHQKNGFLAKKFLKDRGYEEKASGDLIKDWRIAAEEWHIENTNLMVKQLLERRVMTPM